MAASASAIEAGKAFVRIFAEDSQLQRGLKRAEASVKAWGASVRSVGAKIFAVGALGGGAIGGITKFAVNVGSALNDMAGKTGASVEALSALGFAADQNGTSLEAVGNGLKFMQKNIAGAVNGSEEAAEALASLGMSAEQLQGMSPDQQFVALADGISKISDPAQRTAAAMKVFGKSGADLLPLLNQGKVGISGFMREAEALGLIVSGETAQRLDDLGDVFGKLWDVVKAAAVSIGGALAPVLTTITQGIVNVASTITKWIQQNQGLVVTVAAVVAGVMAAGAGLITLGVVISGVGAAIGVVSTVLTAFGAVMGVVVSAVAAILSPIGLVVAAVVGLGGYFLYTTGIIDQAIQWLGGVFGDLAGDVGIAFEAIKAAMSGGDISAAAKVLWALLKLEWQKGVNWLNGMWLEGRDFFLDMWSAAAFKISSFISDAFLAVESAWASTTGWIGDTWKNVVNGIGKLWNGFVDLLYDASLKIVEWMKPIFDAMGIELNVDKVRSQIEAERKKRDTDNQKSHDDEMKRRKEERDARLKFIADQRAANEKAHNDALAEEVGKREQARREEKTKGVKEAEDALAAARAEMNAAVAAANAAKQRGGPGKKPGPPGAPEMPKFDMKAATASVTGTFSGFAAGRIGGGSGDVVQVAKDQLKETKESKAIQKQMNVSLKDLLAKASFSSWSE